MDFLDYIREGTETAREEIERRTGLVRERRELRRLRQQRDTLVKRLGERALQLFGDGEVAQDEIASECQAIITLEDQIARKELEIQRIAQLSARPVAAPVYGRICPRCQIQLPDEAVFCPNCGTRAEDVVPPEPKRATCPACQGSIPIESSFCPRCGASLAELVKAEPAPSKTCSACGYGLSEEAVFCPECGAKVEEPEPTSGDASSDVEELENEDRE